MRLFNANTPPSPVPAVVPSLDPARTEVAAIPSALGPDRFEGNPGQPRLEVPGPRTDGILWAQAAPTPNASPPAAPVPADVKAQIDALALPEGRYAAQLRIEGGVTVGDDGDLNASGSLSYEDRRIRALLAGQLQVDNDPTTGTSTSELSLGGGIVIGLGDPARDGDVVAAQNRIVSDLGDLNDRARTLARDIGGNPDLAPEQKARALRDLGNKLAVEVTEGLTAVQNSEEGTDLPEGLVNQLALRLAGPFQTNGAFEVINEELEALGQSPFPVASTSDAVNNVAGLVEAAGENTVRDNTVAPDWKPSGLTSEAPALEAPAPEAPAPEAPAPEAPAPE